MQHQCKVILKGRLAGVAQAASGKAQAPPELPAAPKMPEAPRVDKPSAESVALRNVLGELTRLAEEIQARRKNMIGDVARHSVELGVAIAEKLLGAQAVPMYLCALIGLALTAAMIVITEYYTATEYAPVISPATDDVLTT